MQIYIDVLVLILRYIIIGCAFYTLFLGAIWIIIGKESLLLLPLGAYT